jgi:DNA-binding protein HU-beta
LTKHEIVDLLSEKSGLKRREVLYIIDNFLDSIIKSLDTAGKLELRNFGTFSRINRKERRIYSPIAGRNLDVPARSVIVFKASKSTDKETI